MQFYTTSSGKKWTQIYNTGMFSPLWKWSFSSVWFKRPLCALCSKLCVSQNFAPSKLCSLVFFCNISQCIKLCVVNFCTGFPAYLRDLFADRTRPYVWCPVGLHPDQLGSKQKKTRFSSWKNPWTHHPSSWAGKPRLGTTPGTLHLRLCFK